MDTEEAAEAILITILRDKLSPLIIDGVKKYLDDRGIPKGDERGKLSQEIQGKIAEALKELIS